MGRSAIEPRIRARATARRWRAALASAGALAGIVVVIMQASAAGDGAAACPALLIPAYVPASELERLAAELPARAARRPVVVVNPANGPGASPDPAYRRAVVELRRRATVVGYVPTSFATRDLAATERDVADHAAWYGVDGIFFDEVSGRARDLPRYRALVSAARRAGAPFTVLNPGHVPAPGYLELGDLTVTFEGPDAVYAEALARMPAWLRSQPPERIAHLVYAAPAGGRPTRVGPRGAGYVYATGGTLPNPWGAVPRGLAGGGCGG